MANSIPFPAFMPSLPFPPTWTRRLFLLLLSLVGFTAADANAKDPAPLDAKAAEAWEMTWSRFFVPETGLFYDYLSSYEKGKELAHLPTEDEVKRQYPNPCGYSTGMEDGAILGGAMLSILCDRYDVTKDESLKAQARSVFEGLQRCLTVHGVEGFLARAISPKYHGGVYINSSRDQYTHAVHGFWRLYRSPLADEAMREELKTLLRAVGNRMRDNVTAENGYDFLRADGQPCPLGICKMWEVKPHEAARLPMIYAAAWDVTQDDTFRQAYLRYLEPALAQSAAPNPHIAAYAMLQMQCSLEVLHELETSQERRAQIRRLMLHVAELSRQRTASVVSHLEQMTPETLAMLGPDWRTVPEWKNQKGYPNPQWGPYRKVWHAIREAGESSLVPLMTPSPEVPADQVQRMAGILTRANYQQMSSCGIVYHVAMYWKARKLGLW